MQRQQKITLGEMRSNNGPHRLLVYCGDYKCAHSVIINAERWPVHVRLSDLEPKFICDTCGRRGADIRPLFERAVMGTGGQRLAAQIRGSDTAAGGRKLVTLRDAADYIM